MCMSDLVRFGPTWSDLVIRVTPKDVYSARSGNDKKEPARQCVTLNGYLLGIMDFRSRDSLVCSTL